MGRPHILLITGPAGIGKSTLSWAIGDRLAALGIAHAAIETDELDRVFPKPTPDALALMEPRTRDVSAINLAALWRTYRALGHDKLILSGVMLHLENDLGWIGAAIPGALVTVIALKASEAALMERLDRREIGPGKDVQAERSLRQARRLAGEAAGTRLVIETDGRTPADLAEETIARVSWLAAPH
ncbi:hypothetical protein BN1110_02160 [bacterium YEK0313]|nr:hypothetical protein BN1110_02160 [bacterium YEK0313]